LWFSFFLSFLFCLWFFCFCLDKNIITIISIITIKLSGDRKGTSLWKTFKYYYLQYLWMCGSLTLNMIICHNVNVCRDKSGDSNGTFSFWSGISRNSTELLDETWLKSFRLWHRDTASYIPILARKYHHVSLATRYQSLRVMYWFHLHISSQDWPKFTGLHEVTPLNTKVLYCLLQNNHNLYIKKSVLKLSTKCSIEQTTQILISTLKLNFPIFFVIEELKINQLIM
jgi:hypothetical protein